MKISRRKSLEVDKGNTVKQVSVSIRDFNKIKFLFNKHFRDNFSSH